MVEIIRADLSNTKHAEALLHLMSKYASDPMGGAKDLSEEVKMELPSTLMARTDTSVILAFHEKQEIGLLTCIEGFSTFACKPLLNIHDAIIKTAYRCKGIINLLLHEAEKIAIETGCCKLTLEVLEGNIPAQLDPAIGKALLWEKCL